MDFIEEIFWEDEKIYKAIKNCYESLPYRIQEVIKIKGECCDY
jgi:hypothetical protein